MTTKINGGYYLKARCIQDSAIAIAPPHVREIWDWLIKEANRADRTTFGRLIKRGECFTSYNDIREGLKWMVGYRKMTYSKSQCETAMKWLTKEGMISTTKTTRGLIITVCNYDTYQNPKNYENHTETYTKPTRKPQSSDTIHKKEEEERNKVYAGALNFYKAQADANPNDPDLPTYKTMAYHLLGKNPQKKIYYNILQMEQQVTLAEFKTMEAVSKETGESSVEIFDEMENYADLRKKNLSVSATAMNWMRRNHKKKAA